MRGQAKRRLSRYSESLAGTLLGAREAVMKPIRPILREMNVTEQQWRVLRVLADEGSLDASGIAEKAILYPPTVTRILRDLTERSLVLREGDPDDGRRFIISITAEGRSLVSKTASQTIVLLESYKEAFGEDRLNLFISEARALAKALSVFADDE